MMKPNVFQVLRNYGWVIKTSPPFITKLTAAAPEKLPLEMFGPGMKKTTTGQNRKVVRCPRNIYMKIEIKG